MFEPMAEAESAKIAIVSPLKYNDSGLYINLQFEDLSHEIVSELDLMMVLSATPEQIDKLRSEFSSTYCIMAFIENPSNDSTAVLNAAHNLANKFLAREMPNNIDVADVRELARREDNHLFAFNRQDSLFDFLESNELGEATGLIYLEQGEVTMESYEKNTRRLGALISPYAHFTCSIHQSELGDCTALVSITPN